MQALILAAGKGERLRPHTDVLAKPAIHFLNIPILGFPLFYLEQAGLTEIVINTHHLPLTVQSAAQSLAHKKTHLQFSREEGEILGGGGGLALAAQRYGGSDENVVLVNGDMVALYPNPEIVRALLERHRQTDSLATLLVCPFPSAKESFGGVYVDDRTGHVKRFSKTALNEAGCRPWHFTGLIVVRRKVWQDLKATPSNLLYDILQPLIDQGARVSALIEPDAVFFETGNPKDYLAATEAALKLLAQPSTLQLTLIKILDRFTPGWWKGWKFDGSYLLCSLPWPDRIRVNGFAVVGPEAQLGSFVEVENSVIAGRVVLKEKSVVKDQLLIASTPNSRV